MFTSLGRAALALPVLLALAASVRAERADHLAMGNPSAATTDKGKPDKARVLERAGLAPETPVKVKRLDGFFRDATKEEDWHDPQEKAEVQRVKRLVQTLKETLADAKVFLVGQRESAYLVGRTDTGWVGLKTRVVQT